MVLSMFPPVRRAHLLRALAVIAFAVNAPGAFALPAYARQTGLACAQCHNLSFGPALTQFGRDFKLRGYTLGNSDTVPLSAMLVTTFTHTGENQVEAPTHHYDRNDNFSADEVSLFYAGRISDHVGVFAQATYSGVDRQTSWDNVDLRYADDVTLGDHAVVAGVSINNSPTVQDLWNSTPVWGFPYIGSELAPAPAGAPLIVEGLGQQVIGATGYAMIDNTVYLEGGLYHGLPNHALDALVGTSADDPNVSGVVPYWRAAVQQNIGANYVSLGTFGLSAELHADPGTRNADRHTDIGVDATWQYADGGDDGFNANATYIRELRHLRASANAGESEGVHGHLDTFTANVGYTYQQRLGLSAGLFTIAGDRNRGLFAGDDPVGGSANGSPDSRGYTVQLEYVPLGHMGDWLAPNVNARFGVQFTGYTKFNGAEHDYDGFGRDASDNDTLLLYAWFAF